MYEGGGAQLGRATTDGEEQEAVRGAHRLT